MKHQSDKMRASITSYGFYKPEKEKEKKETDKELSDNSNNNN